MKVLLIILGVLLLIGLIPVGVIFAYDGQVRLKVAIAFLRLQLMPKKPLTRKQREKAEKKKARKAAKKEEAKKKKQAQSLIAKPPEPPKPRKPLPEVVAGILPWAKLGASFVGEFFHRRLLVKQLRIRVKLAGGDPAALAKNAGTAWETIGIALPILDRAFRVRRRQLVVYPDFVGDKTEAEALLHVQLRVGGLVLMALKYAFRAIRLLFAAKKREKAAEAARKAEAEEKPAAPKDTPARKNAPDSKKIPAKGKRAG